MDIQLYTDALLYWLGGPNCAVRQIDVIVAGRRIGRQEICCTPDLAAVEVTALKANDLKPFEVQYRRFLNHSAITALHWVNISREVVMFKTLMQGRE